MLRRGSVLLSAVCAALALAASAFADTPPQNTSPPTVDGTAEVDQTLHASPGTWSGSPAPTSLTTAQVIGTKTLQDGVGGVSIVANRVTVSGLALGGAPSIAGPLLELDEPAGLAHVAPASLGF